VHLRNQLLFIIIGDFLGIVEKGGVYRVNVLGSNWDFGEEVLLDGGIVGLFVVEGDEAFVRKKD
jgi:hypothetical protein